MPYWGKIPPVAFELQLLLPVGNVAVSSQSRQEAAFSNMMLKHFANSFIEMFKHFLLLQK